MMDHDADYNFSRRIEAIHRHRRWIIAGTALSSVTALVVSLFLAKIYRATTYILVSESKIEASSQNAIWQYSLIRTYVPFVDNDALIGRAIHDLHLDQPPYGLSVDNFRRHRYLDVDIPKGTRLLEIDVEFPDARLAANLANYLAQNAAEFNNQLTLKETQTTQAFLKQRMDQAAQHLAEVEVGRLEVKKSAGLEDREKEVSILLQEKSEASDQLEQFKTVQAQKEAEVKSLGEELSKEPQILSLKKSVISDPYFQHIMKQTRGTTDGSLAVSEESINTVHDHIQQQYADSMALAQSSEAGARASKAALAGIDSKIGRLLEQNAVRRSAIEQADREYAIAKDDFESANRSYQNASVAVTAQSQDLKQLAPAIPPERPVSPNIILNVVLAGVLSCALLSLAALSWENFRAMQWRKANSLEQAEEILASNR
ncbi:MAG TPA: Wzz/FepE/Etk N-terminal domain-containing protein [Terriglobia bacterium]|nr:Wzz/FepE/Etk N-terminal domain-containing protein [Terriglobia bacterium]